MTTTEDITEDKNGSICQGIWKQQRNVLTVTLTIFESQNEMIWLFSLKVLVN